MASQTALMNKLAHKTNFLHELTPEESAAMKKCLLSIFIDIKDICEKHNLIYMMAGGTCLGAVRHTGFIPWDDDLDIFMPREDYETLIELFNSGLLKDRYEIDYPHRNGDSCNVFLKIYRKNTLNREIYNDNDIFPNGVFLDVFPIDYVPKGNVAQLIKGFIANVLRYCSIVVMMAQYPSKALEEFMSLDEHTAKLYKRKRMFGSFLKFFANHNKWAYWFDRFVSSSSPKNPQVGIPTGRKYYNGEIFDKDVYFPVSKGVFEGIEVNLPHQTDRYLRNLYGNYMELPPIEKRERHFVIEFNIPEDL